ncbi:MAG TPA: YceI family protein [Candidatus Acidoferrales bacterium]|nr:YceI family protein [Candidatus Acidoferrales bacterium]
MIRALVATILAIVAFASPAVADTGTIVTWQPDLVHSRAEFTVAHMVLSKVWGHFPIRAIQLTTAGTSLIPTSVSALLDVAHMDTDNHERDADLRSATYFDTADYPYMSFRSTQVTPTGANDFVLTGDLTIKNITKSVSFPVHIIGHIPDSGGTRVGYEGNLTIDRRDFGITDNRLMSGVLFVGYTVDIGITAEATSALPYRQ